VDEVKYSGQGGGHRRKLVDDREEQLAAAASRLDRCRSKYERLGKALVAVKAGVKHLQDKLECVREEAGGRLLQLTDETIARVMSENEKMLIELLARVRIALDDEPLFNEKVFKASLESSRMEYRDEIELFKTRPYNQRIDLPLLDEDWDDQGAHKDSDDILSGELDDELTRDKVKKASSQIMMAQDSRKPLTRKGPH